MLAEQQPRTNSNVNNTSDNDISSINTENEYEGTLLCHCAQCKRMRSEATLQFNYTTNKEQLDTFDATTTTQNSICNYLQQLQENYYTVFKQERHFALNLQYKNNYNNQMGENTNVFKENERLREVQIKTEQTVIDNEIKMKETRLLMAQAFIKLAHLYITSNDEVNAIGILNYANNLILKEELYFENFYKSNSLCEDINLKFEFNKLKDQIKEKLNHAEHKLLLRWSAETPNNINKRILFAEINDTKRKLKNIRTELKQEYERKIKNKETVTSELIYEFYKKITKNFKDFISELIASVIKKLDDYSIKNEKNYKFAIVGLGSLARNEMTPYSDFEFAILMQDIEDYEDQKRFKEYLKKLCYLLEVKVLNIGETLLASLSLENMTWHFDSDTKRGFSLDGKMSHACKTGHGNEDKKKETMQKIKNDPNLMKDEKEQKILNEEQLTFSFINTVNGTVKLQDWNRNNDNKIEDLLWKLKRYHVPTILTNVKFIYGAKELYADYKEKLNTKLNNDKEYIKERSIYLAKDDLKTHSPKISLETSNAMYNVKKDLYRLPNTMLDFLSCYYSIFDEKSNFERINKLHKHNIINDYTKEQLQSLIMIALQIRVEVYFENDSQKEDFNNIKQHENKVKNLYKLSLKLVSIINEFVNTTDEDDQIRILNKFSALDTTDDDYKDFINIITEAKIEFRLGYLIKSSKLIDKYYCKFKSRKQDDDYLQKIQKNTPNNYYYNIAEQFKVAGDIKFLNAEYEVAIDLFTYAKIALYKLNEEQNEINQFAELALCRLDNKIGDTFMKTSEFKKSIEFYKTAESKILKYLEKSDVYITYNNIDDNMDSITKTLVKEKFNTLSSETKELLLSNIKLLVYVYNSMNLFYDFIKGLEVGKTNCFELSNNIFKLYKLLDESNKVLECKQLLRNTSKYCEAIKAHSIALQISKNEKSQLIMDSLSNCVMAMANNCKYVKSNTCSNKLMHLAKENYDKLHPTIASALVKLGVTCSAIGDHVKALKYFEEALEMRIKLFGNYHPDVASSLNNVGLQHSKLGDHVKALNYQEEALAMKENCLEIIIHM